MEFLAGVIWLFHWLVRIFFVLGVPFLLIRRTWDSLLVRAWFTGAGFTFLSQKIFFSDCPLTILELILRDEFMLLESVGRLKTLEAFIGWGVPHPAHVLFALALMCVILCTWATFKIIRGAKKP